MYKRLPIFALAIIITLSLWVNETAYALDTNNDVLKLSSVRLQNGRLY